MLPTSNSSKLYPYPLVSSFPEKGGDLGGAVGGALQGSAALAIGCAQRQRVLADQKLDNDGVGVPKSDMKGRVPMVVDEGQQAPLPRVEIGLRYHQLNEVQWRPAVTGGHQDAVLVDFVAVVPVEELIGVAVCKPEEVNIGALDTLPLLVVHDAPEQGTTHRSAGAVRMSVRSGGVCLSLV